MTSCFERLVFGSMILSVQRVKAEDYLCSFELSNLNRKGEYEQRRYKRSGRQFEVKYANQKVIFEILKETNKFLILTNSFSNIHLHSSENWKYVCFCFRGI